MNDSLIILYVCINQSFVIHGAVVNHTVVQLVVILIVFIPFNIHTRIYFLLYKQTFKDA